MLDAISVLGQQTVEKIKADLVTINDEREALGLELHPPVTLLWLFFTFPAGEPMDEKPRHARVLPARGRRGPRSQPRRVPAPSRGSHPDGMYIRPLFRFSLHLIFSC